MKYIQLFLFFIFITPLSSDEGRLGRESHDYKYNSLGLSLIQTEDTGLGMNLSVSLPGSLYITLERKAEGVDIEAESFDRVINSARIGVHSGIGDLLSSISAKGVNLKIKNVFDIYAEIGIKSTSIEGDYDSFSEDDAQANVITGIRFGDSNGWEGKIRLTASPLEDSINIIVHDSGKGIPLKIQRNIFKPGFTTKNRGWGLGLSLARRIIEEYHNGSIALVESGSEKGTTFKIVLPAAL